MTYPVPPSAVETTTPPPADAALATAVMAHCKAEVMDDFDLFAGWVAAAVELVEAATGLRLFPQTVAVTYSAFPDCGRPLELPLAPVRAITGVAYRDAGGVSQPLTGYGTWLAKSPPLVGAPPGGWPATPADGMAAVTVTAAVGFASTGLIPAQAVQAVKLICGYWHSFRGDGKDPTQFPQTNGIPAGAQRLLDQLRRREYR